MARLARVEVFSPDEVAILHAMNRVVRRCFLLGDDPVTGKNYDHRKAWIEELLKRQAAFFGIDLLGFAIMSNHFHLILRSRPDVVATWDDSEVARRWLMLCPIRKTADGLPEEPSEPELNSIRNNAQRLATIRSRLSDVGWWMRLLCQHVASRANRADQETGKFWQSRYKAVRLLDETALLACAAYVDLNPIRAAMAETLVRSDFTSAQRRIQALREETAAPEPAPPAPETPPGPAGAADAAPSSPGQAGPARPSAGADAFLAPVDLQESTTKPGPHPSLNGCRCSDKGFLLISVADYLVLLDWTARPLVKGKRGRTPESIAPILERLSLSPDVWRGLVSGFGRMFSNVAGQPATIESATSRSGQHHYRVRSSARTLFAPLSKPSA